jgi:hypothetical protein
VVLAALSEAGYIAVIGGYIAVVVLALLIWRRDVQGRRRAYGCIFGLALFGLGFVLAFAAWVSDAVF